jgi:hypothetical protein
MVKTRHQIKQDEKCKKNHENKVQTRSSVKEKSSHLERVELPKIVLSKEMNKRLQLRKTIEKKSKEKMIEKKIKNVKKLYKKSEKQNNEEMLSVWKNLNRAFELIEGLCKFRDRVEGKV